MQWHWWAPSKLALVKLKAPSYYWPSTKSQLVRPTQWVLADGSSKLAQCCRLSLESLNARTLCQPIIIVTFSPLWHRNHLLPIKQLSSDAIWFTPQIIPGQSKYIHVNGSILESLGLNHRPCPHLWIKTETAITLTSFLNICLFDHLYCVYFATKLAMAISKPAQPSSTGDR